MADIQDLTEGHEFSEGLSGPKSERILLPNYVFGLLMNLLADLRPIESDLSIRNAIVVFIYDEDGKLVVRRAHSAVWEQNDVAGVGAEDHLGYLVTQVAGEAEEGRCAVGRLVVELAERKTHV